MEILNTPVTMNDIPGAFLPPSSCSVKHSNHCVREI